MPDAHQNIIIKAIYSGMALGVDSALPVKDKINFGQNLRVLIEGEVVSRPKVDSYLTFNPTQTLVPHIIKTITNKITGGINRIVGISTLLFTGSSTPLIQKATGFSGKPLSIVDFRPEEATEAYAYIADELKMCKVSVSDIISDIGINAPTKAATFIFAKPTRKVIDNITAANIGDWNHLTGSAGVPTAEDRVNTDIIAFLLDSTAPGFASIIPTNTAQIGVGAILTLNGVDDVYVERLMPSTLLTSIATVSKISYDVGSTGLCTIVLSVSNNDIERDSVLFLNGTEYVKVIEVTRDINNIPSIRCKTVGTIANGQTVSGKASFRTYVVNSYVATNTITAKALKTVIGASGISSITKTIDVDLTNADSRRLTEDDFLHVSLRVSDNAQLNEVQIQADINNGAQTFLDNLKYYIVSPNFFTSSASQSASTLAVIQQDEQRQILLEQHILRNQEIDPFGRDPYIMDSQSFSNSPIKSGPTYLTSDGPLQETELGANQWTELFIRIGDLLTVGGDNTRTVKDIKALRFSISAKGPVDFWMDSIWVGGGNELNSDKDVKGLLAYNYIWRVRNKATKAPSNWSPPMREGITIIRGRTVITFTGASSDYSQTDFVIDLARFGGTVNDYRIIATIPNDASTFTDEVSDRVAAQNPPAGRFLTGDKIGDEEVFDFYKPFTFLDTSKYGTCNIVGTKFSWVSGDVLDTSYPRGVQIKINGTLNQLYTNPSSTTQVELEKDMGALTGVNFEIIAPLLTGQPLPIIFGPFGEGNPGTPLIIFGIGNKKSAGTFYWLDGNSPDTQSDINFYEVTSPSEPLLVGGMYDSYGFLFSNRRSFMITPTYTQLGSLIFSAKENANSRGVFSRYSICFGRDFIYFLSENGDGIYRVPGNGNPECLTDGTLYNLFIHSGVNPTNITLLDGTIIYPPDFTKPNDLRLFDSKDLVMFRFIDTNNKQVSLTFDKRIKDWISYDTYLNDSINAFYEEEIESTSRLLIGIDGAIGIFKGDTTRENAIKSRFCPFSNDGGNVRIQKAFDELILDINPGTGGFKYQSLLNNGKIIDDLTIVTGAVSPERTLLVKNLPTKVSLKDSNGGILGRNLSTYLEWTLNAGVKLYAEMLYFLVRGDIITDRSSDMIDGGILGEKFWQGFLLEADTFGEDKTLIFKDDEGNQVATQIINHTGKETKAYSFTIPFIAHSIVRSSSDGIEWIFYNEKYEFNREPEKVLVWEGQSSTYDTETNYFGKGHGGFKLMQRNAIVVKSTDVVILKWTYDNINVESYNLPSTNGVKDKISFFLRARKGKILKPRFESAQPFRLYLNDCEVYMKGYAADDFLVIRPFGGIDHDAGVQI